MLTKRKNGGAAGWLRALALMLAVWFGIGSMGALPVHAEMEVDAKSAILIEASTGKVLYEKNADTAYPPASVTKIMTLLLVMEAVDGGTLSLTDTVTASEYAASMGGSQVYLKVGETMSVEEMIKCVVIASANDAAVALAEHIAGSEEAFVERMNARAAELGMVHTHFENTNGLDDTTSDHVTSARDIATMSAELLRHPKILEYSSIWMDSIRDGAFGLTNTNRLIRFYNGANGLKTGSTAKAGFCISATALRDGMQLIAVIMGAPSRDIRNEAAKKLLDWGFANYCYISDGGGEMEPLPVHGGENEACTPISEPFEAVLPKSMQSKLQKTVELPDYIQAPAEAGTQIGRTVYTVDGETVGETAIRIGKNVEKIGYWTVFGRLLRMFLADP